MHLATYFTQWNFLGPMLKPQCSDVSKCLVRNCILVFDSRSASCYRFSTISPENPFAAAVVSNSKALWFIAKDYSKMSPAYIACKLSWISEFRSL